MVSILLTGRREEIMKSKQNYKSISLFSGAGGMDIGVKESGFSILAQIEIDEHCCNTLRVAKQKDKTTTEIIEEDIRGIAPSTLRKTLKLKKRELDLLFGGPPCQPFSLAGKKTWIK